MSSRAKIGSGKAIAAFWKSLKNQRATIPKALTPANGSINCMNASTLRVRSPASFFDGVTRGTKSSRQLRVEADFAARRMAKGAKAS